MLVCWRAGWRQVGWVGGRRQRVGAGAPSNRAYYKRRERLTAPLHLTPPLPVYALDLAALRPPCPCNAQVRDEEARRLLESFGPSHSIPPCLLTTHLRPCIDAFFFHLQAQVREEEARRLLKGEEALLGPLGARQRDLSRDVIKPTVCCIT